MKKIIILITLSLLFLVEANAWVKINYQKDKWRLFGYSNVQENFTKVGTDCSFSLNCNNPGITRCKFSTYDISNPSLYGCQAIVVNNSSDNDWMEVLDADIRTQISNGYVNGTFVRQDIQVTHPTTNNFENAVVTWTYSSSTDIIEINVYSHNEATGLGII